MQELWNSQGFQSYAQIKIFPIDTKDQIADALTKALAQNDFLHHCHHMCGA
jgi:hypothetical protein